MIMSKLSCNTCQSYIPLLLTITLNYVPSLPSYKIIGELAANKSIKKFLKCSRIGILVVQSIDYTIQLTCLEDIGIIESLVGTIITTEYHHFIRWNIAGRVICSWKRSIALARLKTNIHTLFTNTKDIYLISWDNFTTLLFAIKTSKHHIDFILLNSSDGMTTSSSRWLTIHFERVPYQRKRLFKWVMSLR